MNAKPPRHLCALMLLIASPDSWRRLVLQCGHLTHRLLGTVYAGGSDHAFGLRVACNAVL